MEKKSKLMTVLACFALMLAFGMSVQVAHCSVVFSDNFDSQTDWQPRPGGISNDAAPAGGSVVCDFPDANCNASPPPTGWNFFRSTGLWWGPTYQDTLRISNLAGRGGSGKAFIVYNESNSGASGDGWGADGILTKLLPQDQSELYVRFYLRTQSNWIWAQNQRIGIKAFRSAHFNKSGSIFTAFSGGGQAPYEISDLMNSSDVVGQKYGVEQSASFRCFPQSSDYYCPNSPAGQGLPNGTKYFKTDAPNGIKYPSTDDPHTTGLWADTNWHSFEFHLKMNTYAGNGNWNADGAYEHWYDGVLQSSITNIKWINSGTDTSIGWNTVALGGNALNTYTAASNHGEQWYAIDDVVASTTYSGPPPKPVNVTAQVVSGSNVKVSWVSGTNTASFPIDGYRIYYGTSPTSLNDTITVGNVTSYDIPNLLSGQTYYFAVTGYNKAVVDSNENESLKSSTISLLVSGSTGDTTSPNITNFTVPTTSSSLTVPITTFTASDNVNVTGYSVTDVSTPPLINATTWKTTAPTSITFSAAGVKSAYAWAKDAAGNLSNGIGKAVTITLPDATAPVVSAFTIPATTTTLSVAVSTLTATDAIGVTGYLITESATAPAAGATGWSATVPTSFTFVAAGSKTAYAWAKDAAGNVSLSRSAAVTITLPDTTAPVVSAFTMPTTSTSLTVAVSSLTATDAIGVIGYLITESATAPAAGATGWSATVPTSFTFVSAGSKTAYAWAKDAAGNVSLSRSAAVTITLPDTIAPVVSAFTMPTMSTSLTVAVSSLAATDAVGVTGYLITNSSTKPLSSATGWTASAPASVTYTTAGSKTAYAWAKDAAGNVSLSISAVTTITLPDTTAPVVSAFMMPATSSFLTVLVTTLTATDAVGVTGYLITESATAPSAGASGWSASVPTSIVFTTEGSKTAYAWARDAAGNVSLSRSAVVIIDTIAPAVSIGIRKDVSSLSGMLTVAATASDNLGVSGVEFYVNGTLVTTVLTAPYVFNWDSTAVANGSYTLTAKAYDVSGNIGQSASIRISVPSCKFR